jgi:chromosome segregation ATPase
MRSSILTTCALGLVLSAVVATVASGQVMPKAQVANLISKVENGVDEFEKYLERRGENAKDAKDATKDTAAAAQASGRRSRPNATESQKAKASAKKDKLDSALDDLNRSTNRLRRKFDATDAWIETKAEVQRVVDDGRAINAEVARGSYGTEVARLWAALRTGINDLARAYNIPPLGV